MKTYWLSFSNDEGSLGVCVVEAASPHSAIIQSTMLGINPGGEALIIELDDTQAIPDDLPRNRLVQGHELEAMGLAKGWDELTEEERKRYEEAESISGDDQ